MVMISQPTIGGQKGIAPYNPSSYKGVTEREREILKGLYLKNKKKFSLFFHFFNLPLFSAAILKWELINIRYQRLGIILMSWIDNFENGYI